MPQVHFHCSDTRKDFVDYCGAVVDDLAEAGDHATRVVECFICERRFDDWRDRVLHVSDDRGDELFIVPFTFVLGKAHLRQHAQNSAR
ncbi:hypothetical protein N2603_25905 [Bradyrhizobium huanghuaihaiense]|uniref:DUF6894 family protein n=1 Tax=Bradyrhizobium huanghuaihaiense TaxID=990078 RepID=UPI0021A9D3C1|nr:hypothetical protein [Bradyrhizobium sp. CB3035]UWU73518.1 hypothetical protein N2603_25905 [Bradyrhizobium sp. CB3035]